MADTRSEDWLERVRRTAAEPSFWLQTALKLSRAADDLWVAGNEHDRHPAPSTVIASYQAPGFTPPNTGGLTCDVCFMLFGFAIENLAKGIIVCLDPKRVTRRRLSGWHGKGHDLAGLCDSANVALTDDERALLTRVSRIVVWKGRYPVPMNFYDTSLNDPMSGYIAVGESWPQDDYDGLVAMFDKTKAGLKLAMKRVPPLPADYVFEDD